MLLRHVTCVGIIASLCRDQRLSPAITAAAQNSQHPIFVWCSADRRVTDNNVITACSSNGYNHIIFRVQTHNVCRNQQTTEAVIIGCTRRHVSTCDTRHTESWSCWSWAACCQNHAMQISSPGAALLLACKCSDIWPQTSAILQREGEKCTNRVVVWKQQGLNLKIHKISKSVTYLYYLER